MDCSNGHANPEGNSFCMYCGSRLGEPPADGASAETSDAPAPSVVEAAWYPDPLARHEHRYWDGTEWTAHVSDQGTASVDEPVPDPGDGATTG